MYYLDHSDSFKEVHLNRSNIHLNKRGMKILSNNLCNHLQKIFNWNQNRIVTDSNLHTSNSTSGEDLKNITKSNFKKLIFAHLNINSIRNKFDALADLVKGNVDVLMVSETKFDNSFPKSQFLISGYKEPFCLDRNKNGGGIMLFSREDIPATLKLIEKSSIKAFFVELTINKKRVVTKLQLQSSSSEFK